MSLSIYYGVSISILPLFQVSQPSLPLSLVASLSYYRTQLFGLPNLSLLLWDVCPLHYGAFLRLRPNNSRFFTERVSCHQRDWWNHFIWRVYVRAVNLVQSMAFILMDPLESRLVPSLQSLPSPSLSLCGCLFTLLTILPLSSCFAPLTTNSRFQLSLLLL